MSIALAKLYAEDADWNALVEALSSAKIERQVRRAEMFKGAFGRSERHSAPDPGTENERGPVPDLLRRGTPFAQKNSTTPASISA